MRAWAQAACWEGPTVEVAGRTRAERTWNMYCMVVTLEVSTLSGRLNAHAPCRESNGGHSVRGKVRPGWREAAGDRGAHSVQERA